MSDVILLYMQVIYMFILPSKALACRAASDAF